MRHGHAIFAVLSALAGSWLGAPPAIANPEQKPSAGATEAAAARDAADEVSAKPPAKVKYTAGKEVDFEELLIQGRLQRPEVTVVTGDSGDGTDGLLRLRQNFHDRMAVEIGEEVK